MAFSAAHLQVWLGLLFIGGFLYVSLAQVTSNKH
jgi:hypothetical protein